MNSNNQLNWNEDFSTLNLHPEQDPLKQLIAKEDDEERFWNSYNKPETNYTNSTQQV